MRGVYTLSLYLSVPWVLLRLWWRGRKNPAYRHRIAERFGFFSSLPDKPRIWLHAVSVGETIASAPLVENLLATFPDHAMLITTTTPTGSAQVRRLFAERVEHVYFPYDLPTVLWRFLARTKPDILIVMETELWPNLYHVCRQRQIPVLIANARLSEKSLAGYSRLRALIAPTIKNVALISPQSKQDAERFHKLGACETSLRVCGNLKFDLQLQPEVQQQGLSLRIQLGKRPVWIAASTHPGEEEQLLAVHRKVLRFFSDALLILVPRHPERFDEVAGVCEKLNFGISRRSLGELPDSGTPVYLADTMGELLQLYAASDIAFVAGSLGKTGGHNPLEPAALSLPVITGPWVHNFTAVYELLMADDAAMMVQDVEECATLVARWFSNDAERKGFGERARQVVSRESGAQACLLDAVRRLLPQR